MLNTHPQKLSEQLLIFAGIFQVCRAWEINLCSLPCLCSIGRRSPMVYCVQYHYESQLFKPSKAKCHWIQQDIFWLIGKWYSLEKFTWYIHTMPDSDGNTQNNNLLPFICGYISSMILFSVKMSVSLTYYIFHHENVSFWVFNFTNFTNKSGCCR